MRLGSRVRKGRAKLSSSNSSRSATMSNCWISTDQIHSDPSPSPPWIRRAFRKTGKFHSLVPGTMRLIRLRLAKDGHDSALIYTKARDIHYAGVVFLQMLSGRDVVERFPDSQAALVSCESCRWTMYAAYTPPLSADTPSPSTNCVEHGLSKEEIYIMCCHSRRTSSNLVHEIAPSHDTNIR
jgi:hypothetical protein